MLTSTDQYWRLAQGISRWGGVSPRKTLQGPAPFQLKTFPQRPCLVLMRAACPEGGLLSPFASFLWVFTPAEGRFCCSLPLLILLGGDPVSERALWYSLQPSARPWAPGVLCPAPWGSLTSSIRGACSLPSHLRVATGWPHSTLPTLTGPVRQDAASVPGGEAQPAAGLERLLSAVLLVSPAWAETHHRLRASA